MLIFLQPVALLFFILPSLTVAAIQWGNCSSAFSAESSVPLSGPGLQCAEFSVPLSWNDPQGQNITLGLTRLRTNNTASRIGSLLVNPGGPGQPTSELIAGQALGFSFFPESITSSFDLIGMDPRGFGLSTGIMCDPNLWNQRVTEFPSSQEEYNSIVSVQSGIWESCYNMSGELLYNIDTKSVTRDMEAVRVALNDGPLNFLGISYGSVIAQTYAQLYPDNYRAIAMDGIVDHNSSATNLFFASAQTYESGLHQFALWCNSTNSTNCPLTGTDILGIWNETITNATNSPIPAPGCGDGSYASLLNGSCYANITGEEILTAISDLLLFKDPRPPVTPGWPGFAEVFALAAEGNGTAASQAYAAGYLATSNTSSSIFASIAVTCLDERIETPSYADVRYRLNLGSYIAPLTRGSSQAWSTQMQCIGFGRAPTYPQTNMMIPMNFNPNPIVYQNGSVEAQPTANGNTTAILIVQSKYDPSCNYLWAENVRAGIANSTLLLRDGDGHTSYLLDGEASRAINAYFVNLTLPAPDTVVAT